MKKAVITGANSGLGYEVAHKLAENEDYMVILACRNNEKATAAAKTIIEETGNQNVKTVQLDTSSLESVRHCAEELIEQEGTIDVLLNNAGISAMGHDGFTEEGFEVVFATNYLGHFLLTQLLLPHMSEDARIYNVSSDMHNPPQKIEWPGAEGVAHPTENDRSKYSYSKLAMIYFAHEQDKIFKEEGSHKIINAFNPGFMSDTNFSKGGGKARDAIVRTTMPDRYGKLSTSSEALAQIIMGEEYGNISGEYFDRSVNTARSSELSYNEENARELYEASLKFCGLE